MASDGSDFGATVIRPFKVEGRQAGANATSAADGQLQIKPPLEPYKWPVIGILALLVIGGIAFAAMSLLGGGDDDANADADPTATTAAASATAPAATATPTGLYAGGNGIIANSDPVPSNTNCLAVRSAATRNDSNILGRLCTGERVAIKAGPTEADGFVWWQIEASNGLAGWAAEKSADGTMPFITPATN